MKTVLALVVGLVLGFGAAWATFEQPWTRSERTQARPIASDDVAAKLVNELRGDDILVEAASCVPRRDKRSFICTAIGGNLRARVQTEHWEYVATVEGRRVTFERRFAFDG